MEKEKQFDIYKDLFYTCAAINSSKIAQEDLQKVSMADALLQHLDQKANYFRTIVLSSLYSIPEADRTQIMSHAFNYLSSINNEISLEGNSGYFDKNLNTLNTLIDLNNQVTLVKYSLQSEEEQQEYLSSLPSNQLQSFKQFIDKQVSKSNSEETTNQGEFDNQMRLEDLQEFLTNLPTSQEN